MSPSRTHIKYSVPWAQASVHCPNSISIGSAGYAQRTSAEHTQTDAYTQTTIRHEFYSAGDVGRNVRRISVMGVSAPLLHEAKKILKI